MTSDDSYRECFTCGKWFAHATTLREHENYSCQARVLFVCIPCGMTFDNDNFMDQHLIRHNRRARLLLDQDIDLDNAEHKCDLCKTPFISPFTLATHQLYSCPAICECALRNLPDVTTTHSEDDAGTSEDEVKLKIVEDAFKYRKKKILNKKNSKSKKLLEKMSNASETDENIESNCKNESELRNAGKIIPANMNATLDENSVSTSNALQTTETQTKLSGNDNGERSNSSVDPPGKELSTAQKSSANEEEKRSLVSGSESLKNEAELKTTTQQLKVPLKMVLKLKNIVDNVTLSFKTNESSSKKISKVPNVLTTNNCSSGNVDENINVISNGCVDVLGNERGLDESEKLLAKNERRNFKRPQTYPCRICGRCFAHPETRTCHENTICVEDMTAKEHRSYACTKCDSVFQGSNSFDLHIIAKCRSKLKTLNASVLKPVTCQYCARNFVQTTTLATHLKYCCTAKTKGQNLEAIVTTPATKKEEGALCPRK